MDFWNWARRKAVNVLAASWAVLLVLQLIFGGMFDFVTGVIMLVLLTGVGQIDRLEKWWRR